MPGAEAGLVALGLRRVHAGRLVLDGVDLEVRPGEVVGLLGPNGAGKSTAFRLLAGIDAEGQGEVRLGGRALDGLPLWARVRAGLGYLPQEPSLFRELSALDNLRLALEPRGAAAEAPAHLRAAGLEARAEVPAGRLSGGERRRLEIARCLALQPRVVLLDEPFAGVDPIAVADLQERIRGLAGPGLGVLLTDHAVHETLPICDRALILVEGRVVAAGSPAEVAADPRVRARYLGPDFKLDRPIR